MEREVKFRGKSKNTGDWLYGVPLKSVNDNMYLIHSATEDAINTFNDVDFVYSEVIPETVGQFTGLKDKNGVEIYEGDVIAHKLFPDDVEIVKYKDGGFRVGKFLLSTFHCSIIKRVGNIFDNPELIANLE